MNNDEREIYKRNIKYFEYHGFKSQVIHENFKGKSRSFFKNGKEYMVDLWTLLHIDLDTFWPEFAIDMEMEY